MKVLLLGSTGYVGSYILQSEKFSFVTVGRSQNCDYTLSFDSESIINDIRSIIIKENISVFVNAVAAANLDFCEENKQVCERINYELVVKLVDLCKEFDIHFVHFSTNAVYDGEQPKYSEKSEKKPINYYGVTKARADNYITRNIDKYSILRAITLYGRSIPSQRDNPVTFIIKKLINNENIKLVDDNIVNILHVEDLILAFEVVVLKRIYGEFNLSGDISESRYQLGERIAKVCGFDLSLIEEISGKDFIMPAARPYDTSFNNEKMKAVLGLEVRDLDKQILNVFRNINGED